MHEGIVSKGINDRLWFLIGLDCEKPTVWGLLNLWIMLKSVCQGGHPKSDVIFPAIHTTRRD